MATRPTIKEPVAIDEIEGRMAPRQKKGMTTIEVPIEVRIKLETMKVDSKEAIVRPIERLIDANDAAKTTNGMVTLEMPRNKYEWLMRKQTNLDCLYVLRGYVK